MAGSVSGYRALQQRDPVLARRYYERSAREERFYREIASAAAAPAPSLYYSAADETSQHVVLLLEDLSSGRPSDVLHGCSIGQATQVVEAIAPFHAQWWAERAPPTIFPRWADNRGARQQRYDRQVGLFLQRYGDELPGAALTIVERVGCTYSIFLQIDRILRATEFVHPTRFV
jgi:hypothetical protein